MELIGGVKDAFVDWCTQFTIKFGSLKLARFHCKEAEAWEVKRRIMGCSRVSVCVRSQNVKLTRITWGARQKCAHVILPFCTQPLPRPMVKTPVPSRHTKTIYVLRITCYRLLVEDWSFLRMESLSLSYHTVGMANAPPGFLCLKRHSGLLPVPRQTGRRVPHLSVVRIFFYIISWKEIRSNKCTLSHYQNYRDFFFLYYIFKGN